MSRSVLVYPIHQPVTGTCDRFPTEHLATCDKHIEVFLGEDLRSVGIVDQVERGDVLLVLERSLFPDGFRGER